MPVTVSPLHPLLGAVCSGIDISEPPRARDIAAIETGMDRHAVLVFHHATPLTTEQQIAFTRGFGDLEPPYTEIRAAGGVRLGDLALSDISNLDVDDQILARDDRKRLSGLGNRLWHSDSSYKAIPARYSLLNAHVVPPEGGDTQFADMRAAYDALDARTRSRIDDLVCEHSLIHSKGALGLSYTDAELRAYAPVRQRLVRTHPGTGRKSLFLASHAGRIEGLPDPEARMLLRHLMEHATQREFVFSHSWRVGDLVMWDNRTTMHRARAFEDSVHKRDMRRTTTTDGMPTISG